VVRTATEYDLNKQLTLIAAILGSIVVFVDGTIVNVALPHIRSGLDSDFAGQQWIVDAYLLTLSAFILIGGSLGDLLGRRRIFAIGTAAFGLTSLLCAFAPTIEVLIAGRALQGVAGALLIPSTLGLIVATFDAGERGAAIGTWTAWTGIAIVIGPLGGGLILEAASWRWIFAINVVPILLTLAIIWRIAAPRDHPKHQAIDFTGAALCAIGLGGPIFALIEQQRYGWSDPLILVPLLAGLVALGAFLVFEWRAKHPMLPLGLFRDRNFSAANAATLAIYAAIGALTFVLVVFLQQVAGYSALAAGATLLPMTVLMFLLSKRFGALSDRYGPRFFMAVGPLVAGVGVLLLVRTGSDPNFWTVLFPGVVLFGLGLALTVAPLTATVLGAVPQERASIASGVNNAVARVAGLVAVALAGAVLAARFGATIDDREEREPFTAAARTVLAEAKLRPMQSEVPADVPDRSQVQTAIDEASVDGLRLSLAVTAALMFAGAAISAVGIRNPRRELRAEQCPGGQICGASSQLEGTARPEPATAWAS
jgi:EmrB/QacA subfamily drug resistance transporter